MQRRTGRVSKNKPRFETGARIPDESIDSVFSDEDGDGNLPLETSAATEDEGPLFAEEPVSSDGFARRKPDPEPELFADEGALLRSSGTGPPLWLPRGALALGTVMLVIGLVALSRSSPPTAVPPSPALAPPTNVAIPSVASAVPSQSASTPPEPTASSSVATNEVASVTEPSVAAVGLARSTAEPVAAVAVPAASKPPAYQPVLPAPEPITGLGETTIGMAASPRSLPTLPAAVSATSDEPSVRPGPLDETAGVREILARYMYAYADLDARAVAAVWPTVNQAALDRAFAALETQNISFSKCEVTVSGGTARAVCAGTAAWTPKVGGRRSREDERTWTFALTQRDDSWTIVSAEMR